MATLTGENKQNFIQNVVWKSLAWLGYCDCSDYKFLDELTIHLFPVPFCLVSKYYHKFYNFLWTNPSLALDVAENQFGLNREEACNNLLFYIAFNAFGGLQVFMMNMVKYIATTGVGLCWKFHQYIIMHAGVVAVKNSFDKFVKLICDIWVLFTKYSMHIILLNMQYICKERLLF